MLSYRVIAFLRWIFEDDLAVAQQESVLSSTVSKWTVTVPVPIENHHFILKKLNSDGIGTIINRHQSSCSNLCNDRPWLPINHRIHMCSLKRVWYVEFVDFG
jgi:hypothetical protein